MRAAAAAAAGTSPLQKTADDGEGSSDPFGLIARRMGRADFARGLRSRLARAPGAAAASAAAAPPRPPPTPWASGPAAVRA